MFDERVPPELRELLSEALAGRQSLEGLLAWTGAFFELPPEFDEVMRAELGRMEKNAWGLVERYRSGELTLGDFETKLWAEFSSDRPPSPELEAWLARTEKSRTK
jgi:hypothetical protein